MVFDDYASSFPLIPAMMHRKEEKIKLPSNFPLNIDLKPIMDSKILTASIYLSITAILHMLGVFVFNFSFSGGTINGKLCIHDIIIPQVYYWL